MALRMSRDPRISSLIGQLVRLEVMGAGFDIRAASEERHSGKPDRLRVRWAPDGLVDADFDLDVLTIDDVGAVGAKAAQMSRLVAGPIFRIE